MGPESRNVFGLSTVFSPYNLLIVVSFDFISLSSPGNHGGVDDRITAKPGGGLSDKDPMVIAKSPL
jgi:hypothetical protein